MTLQQHVRGTVAALISVMLVFLPPLAGAPRSVTHAAATSICEPTGMCATVDSSGAYSITTQTPAWTFGGTAGHTLSAVTVASGTDAIGSYTEITFGWQGGVARTGGIRIYASNMSVLFTTQYLAAAANAEPFPTLATYPYDPYHLDYQHGAFSTYEFRWASDQGPWLSFDGSDEAFLLSPAANYMTSQIVKNADSSLSSRIDTRIANLPQGFTHRTILTVGIGINHVYDMWGSALTALGGKTRAANNADVTLSKLGYWTDNGATYYYNYDTTLGYEGTLQTVRSDFAAKGIQLGYLQIDSWWYPKGASDTWQGDPTGNRGGEYVYTAAPDLLPDGLSHFQQTLGLPLITHARWIDPASPYRTQYQMSNNVSIDPNFWNTIFSYIHGGGVLTYEQDWLDGAATTSFNLNDPYAFLDNMAAAARANGMTLQYCMATPDYFLQGTNYTNLVSMRVSSDRFGSDKWDRFLYGSRLAKSMDIWPWSDVFMSTETTNLLLSTLSGGIVGVGDPIGSENPANLLQAILPDGTIVKPDDSLIPTDETYINDAQGNSGPMVGYTYTDHTGLRDANVFAYSRSTTANQTASFSLAEVGITTAAYVYNYFSHAGTVVPAGGTYSDSVSHSGTYYLVTPIGQSGIALIGDAGKFVAAGRARVGHLDDDGAVHATISFADKEGPVTLFGYAPYVPTVSATNGAVGNMVYDGATKRFSFVVSQGSGLAASITLTPSAPSCPSGWSCVDIGAPSPAGSQSLNAGAWTISGGGADIGSTVDQFHLVYQPVNGDSTLAAQVLTQTNTNLAAKTGLMLRATTNPAAPFYAVFVTAGNGVEAMWRTTQGATAGKTSYVGQLVPVYLKLTRTGNSFSAYYSKDGAAYTLVPGSTQSFGLATSLLGGVPITSHNNGTLGTAAFGMVAITAASPSATSTVTLTATRTTTATPMPTGTWTATPTSTATLTATPLPASSSPTPTATGTLAPSCPSGWSCVDIGAPSPAGSQSLNNGAWTISGGGADIGSTVDQFHLVYQPVNGDSTLVAQVLTQTNTNLAAKTGLMLRVTTDPAAPFYAVFVTAGNGVEAMWRTTQGATAGKTSYVGQLVPVYLKLTRTGNSFSAYYSRDGAAYTLVPGSTQSFGLATSLLGGMPITSHNNGTPGTATLDDVSL